VERLPHPLAPARELVQKRRPHLKDRVGEPELEDRAGDRRVRRLRAKVESLPRLPPAGLESMKRSVFGSFVEKAIEPSVPSISVAQCSDDRNSERKASTGSSIDSGRSAASSFPEWLNPALPCGRAPVAQWIEQRFPQPCAYLTVGSHEVGSGCARSGAV
jgi:hypothetical protein